MNIQEFKNYMTADYLMGPNSLRILEELLIKHPILLKSSDQLLDLGCGKGLTSYAIAKETTAKIYANDLWISEKENAGRFKMWGLGNQLIPVCEDATRFSFKERMFQGLISVDAYHYFGTEENFFKDKILPFLDEEATVLIGIPGIKDQYSGRSKELLEKWLKDEAYMFQSPSEWKRIIGEDSRIETVETWEMECFDVAWGEWFDTKHKYALGDLRFFDSIIKPYTCFVGIYIKIK